MIGKTNAISGVSEPVPKIRTVSGSVISISNALALPAVSLVADINAVQNLNGYDSPWAGGAGKNKFNQADSNYLTVDTSVFAYKDEKVCAQLNTLQAGTYTLTWKAKIVQISPTATDPTTGRYGLYFRAVNNGVNFNVNGQLDVANPTADQIITNSVTFTLTSDYVGKFTAVWIYCGRNTAGGYPDTCNFYDVQIESGSTATAFEPYENICPISGWSNVNVYREAQYDAGATPYATINLNGTVYGGSLDVITGVLTVDRAQIASYAGETLPSTWISDRDVYSAGVTPTTGAQVVYELATPQTVQLTPTQVQMLLGNNTLWADSGDSELQYWARR